MIASLISICLTFPDVGIRPSGNAAQCSADAAAVVYVPVQERPVLPGGPGLFDDPPQARQHQRAFRRHGLLQRIDDPPAMPASPDDARIPQILHMPRHLGLGETEDASDIAYAEFA